MQIHSTFRRCKRSTSLVCLAALLGLASSATGARADSDGWKISWKNGLKFSSEDGNHALQVGGRTFADFAYISEDDALRAALGGEGQGTGVEFRAARIFVSGKAYKRLAWKTEYDFGGDKVKDIWISIKKVPVVGNLKFGHFKEPFSLDELTSLRFVSFMERSLSAAFNPSRNVGVQINDNAFDKRMTWALGVFRETSAVDGFSDSSAYQITGRMTGAPVYRDGGREAVHVGLSYSHKFRELGGGEDVRWKAKSESHLAQTVADSGTLDTDGADLLNLEAAAVYGSLAVQAEYTTAWADMGGGSRDRSWGLYAQASYFLTGEHRSYDLKKGAFNRTKILKPLGEGSGAWQVAARFSRLRLNSGGVNMGNIRDITLGLNWYPYSNFRVMANYIHSNVSNADMGVDDENAQIVQLRAQIDF